jgi:membrane protein YqaA with SNARE-associated domain
MVSGLLNAAAIYHRAAAATALLTTMDFRFCRTVDGPMTALQFSEEAGYIGLFVSSFVSATLLPGGSEIVLVALVQKFPEAFWRAILVATIGNTAGGMTSYALGRLLPNRVEHRAIIRLHRCGYWALLLSWLPVIGDALCVAAGWLRFDPWRSALLLAAGKLARYVLVAGGWTWLAARWLT